MSKLTKSICTRITEDEYVAVHNQVDNFGFGSVNDLIRAYIQTALCFRFDYDKFFDVAAEISVVGDKINQIAKEVNSTLVVTEEQIKMLNCYMQELDEIMDYDFGEMATMFVYNAQDNVVSIKTKKDEES